MHFWRFKAAAPVCFFLQFVAGPSFAQDGGQVEVATLQSNRTELVGSTSADPDQNVLRGVRKQRLQTAVLASGQRQAASPDRVNRRLDAAFSLVVSPVAANTAAANAAAVSPPVVTSPPIVRSGSRTAAASAPSARPAPQRPTVLAYAEPSDRGTASKPGESAIRTLVDRQAQANNVSPALAHALVRIESNYNPKATGRRGEVGLLQINPRTARAMGFNGSRKALYDPATNLAVGMRYLGKAQKLAGGDVCGTLLRYNAGLDATRGTAATNKFCARVKSRMG